jgi:uncharacterized surface protein with fasciclin (FAS1) repeats
MRAIMIPGIGVVCPDIIDRRLCNKDACATPAPSAAPSQTPNVAGVLQQPGLVSTAGDCTPSTLALSALYAAAEKAVWPGGSILGTISMPASQQTFTVFAPTNDAMAAAPYNVNAQTMVEVLSYHVLLSKVTTTAIDSEGILYTLLHNQSWAGPDAFVQMHVSSMSSSRSWQYSVNQANLLCTNRMASNGVVHTVDSVLLPPSLRDVYQVMAYNPKPATFQTFVQLLAMVGLPTLLQNDNNRTWTVLAPTETAFSGIRALVAQLKTGGPKNMATLTQILNYHIIPGSFASKDLRDDTLLTSNSAADLVPVYVAARVVSFCSAAVVAADLRGSNGYVHVIDKLLMPPALRNALQALECDRRFSSFVDGLSQAKSRLITELATGGPFTIFAPENSAYALMMPKIQQLIAGGRLSDVDDILRSFVWSGSLKSDGFLKAKRLAMLNGVVRAFSVNNGTVFLSGLAVVGPYDVTVSNGLVHTLRADITTERPDLLPQSAAAKFSIWTGARSLALLLILSVLVC